MKKDLLILKQIKEAWQEIESGKFKTLEKEDFFKEIKDC